MARTQVTNSHISALQSSPSSILVVEAVPLANSSNPFHCDTSTGTQRPLILLARRCMMFNSLHGLSHHGIQTTQKVVTARYLWPGINADVHSWTLSPVYNSNAPRSRGTETPLSHSFQSLILMSLSFMLIWLDHFHQPMFSYTC